MKRIMLMVVIMFLVGGCHKQESCPYWNPSDYNTIASACCNFKDYQPTQSVKVTGWIYEAHASVEESYPSVYLADFLWAPGHKEADAFIRLFCPPQTNWNPVEYKGKRLYITGDISYEYLPENGTKSYSLFLVPNMIDTLPQ